MTSDFRQATLRSAAALASREAAAPVSDGNLGHTRLRAQVTANNGDGTYAVTTFGASGVTIESALLVLAFPAITTIAVDTYCWVDFLPGSEKGMLDATGIAAGGSGGSAEIIVIGAPGYLSGT